MALTTCPKCGGKVSTAAPACPHCGHATHCAQNPVEKPRVVVAPPVPVDPEGVGQARTLEGTVPSVHRKRLIWRSALAACFGAVTLASKVGFDNRASLSRAKMLIGQEQLDRAGEELAGCGRWCAWGKDELEARLAEAKRGVIVRGTKVAEAEVRDIEAIQFPDEAGSRVKLKELQSGKADKVRYEAALAHVHDLEGKARSVEDWAGVAAAYRAVELARESEALGREVRDAFGSAVRMAEADRWKEAATVLDEIRSMVAGSPLSGEDARKCATILAEAGELAAEGKWAEANAVLDQELPARKKKDDLIAALCAAAGRHVPQPYAGWPFDAAEAARRQKETAQVLNEPAERSVDLGGGVKLELVLIPAGEYDMGSPGGEAKRSGDEGPVHRVRITRPFYLGKHEVTQEQWERVMGTDSWVNPSHFKGGRNPVDSVSWFCCRDFLKKLNALGKDRQAFRLPTEAEWEYACRAGTDTPFHFGETISTGQANYNGDYVYGNGRKGECRKGTVPVGSFPANAWGLYDMHGNVMEWCEDYYGDDYYRQSPKDDPSGPASGNFLVLRGGSWANDPQNCRSATRDRFPFEGLKLVNDNGFRVVLPFAEAGTADVMRPGEKAKDQIESRISDVLQAAPLVRITRIEISKPNRVASFYAGEKLLRRYPIGLGEDLHEGELTITTRVVNPDWSAGGKKFPSGDPGNPLGTRWLGFSESMAAISGTNDESLIGKEFGGFSIIMRNKDIEEIFDFCKTGTVVRVSK